MKRMESLRALVIAVVFIFSMSLISACSSGPSPEQMTELKNLQAEVQSLQDEASSLKADLADLEAQIAEKNAQLQECAKIKQETEANLEKLSK